MASSNNRRPLIRDMLWAIYTCRLVGHSVGMQRLKETLRELYYGDSRAARLFRYSLVIFDLATVVFFLGAAIGRDEPWPTPIDVFLGLLFLLEFVCRLWVTTNKNRLLFSWVTLADVVVIFALLVPIVTENVTFLRVFRAMRLLRSYHLLRDLKEDVPWFRTHQEVVERSITFFVFVLIVTSFVFVTQRPINPDINNFIDALYFTIATLTTTGFGDITLKGPWGRLEAVVIMIVGVSMFLQLLQAIFRPNKVRYTCHQCALTLHDSDAVHCKACGAMLKIRN